MPANNPQGESPNKQDSAELSFEEYFGEVPEDNLHVVEVAYYAERAWDNRTTHYQKVIADKDAEIVRLNSIIIKGSAAVLMARFDAEDELNETLRLIACTMVDDRKRLPTPTDNHGKIDK